MLFSSFGTAIGGVGRCRLPTANFNRGQGRVTYELILSSLQLFLKKLVFLRAILYNEAWEKNFMP